MVIAEIHITLKNGILDPQGKAVRHALSNLGINDVGDVRVGKFIRLEFDVASLEQAEKLTEGACQKLLANPIIEDYQVKLVATEQRNGK